MVLRVATSALHKLRRLGGAVLAPVRRRRYAKTYESRDLVNGRLPVIYISQIWRSGGTMLSQFFDSVPGILAFPKELKFGVGKRDLLCLDEWCERPAPEVRHEFMRVNGVFGDAMRGRYDKSSGASLPFRFDVGLFSYLFDRSWKDHPPRSGRDLASIFFSAFFSAWLDRRSSTQPPRYISGFASFMALRPENVDRYFGYYPDGYLIQIIREPVAWYRSVRAKSLRGLPAAAGSAKDKRSIDRAIEMYRQQGITLGDNLRKHPGRCFLLDYDKLVADPDSHMAGLCELLGLEYSEIASQATFNGLPIAPNTSFRNVPIPRESILSANEIHQIEREAIPIYEEAARLTGLPLRLVASQ